MGFYALAGNTTGGSNTAIGSNALIYLTTGAGHTAVGYAAGQDVTTGVQGTYVGGNAGANVTTGNNNVFVGYNAGDACTTGTPNVAVGVGAYGSGGAGGGTENVAIGHQAMASADSGGLYNTCVGNQAGYYITTGDYNVAIGRAADQVTTTGSFNIMIGPSAKPSANSGTSQTVIGYNVEGNGNSSFTFGSGSTDTSCDFGSTTWALPSDERIKEEIEDDVIGLSFINDLRPRTFRYRKEKDIPEALKSHVSGSEERFRTDKYQHGFIAQEVKEAIDKHNFKDGFDMWSENENDGRQLIGPTAVIPMLIKAIQELSAEVEKLKGE